MNKFLLIIDNVFYITGRGTLVLGRVLKGQIKQGDELEIRSADKVIKTKCTMLEKYQKVISEAQKGDYIAVYLANVKKSELSQKMQLVIPDE